MTNGSNQDRVAPQSRGVNLSVGSGLAICGSLMFGGGLTAFLVLFNFSDIFVDNSAAFEKMAESDDILNDFVMLLILFFTALPGFAAYWLTKMIIGANDD